MRQLLVIGAVLLVAACASTSDAIKWYQAQTTYNSVMDSLVSARLAGEIDDTEYVEIEKARVCAQDALDDMKVYAFDGIEGNIGMAAWSGYNNCINSLIIATQENQ